MKPIIVCLLLLGVALAGGCAHSDEPAAGKKTLYTCPMHPEYVSDQPGDCPICGMRLVPKEQVGPKPPAPAAQAPRAADPHAGHSAAAPPSSETSGTRDASVPRVLDLGANRASLAGIRTVVAERGRLAQPIRAVGTVAVDETRVRQVTTKVAGFVERLHVNATGQMVTAGEPLFELYLPELLASQEEYLRARRSAQEFEQSALPEVRRGGEELAAAARRRLELFDVPAEFIERLERDGPRPAHRHLQGAVRGLRDGQERGGGAAHRAGDGPPHGDGPFAGLGDRPGLRSRSGRSRGRGDRRASRCRSIRASASPGESGSSTRRWTRRAGRCASAWNSPILAVN